MQREQMLEQAKQTVCHDRNTQYGEPEDNFKVIAELWTAYLFGKSKANGGKFSLGPDDVASMMILFKVARNSSTPKDDNWVDIAGYAACGCEVSQTEMPY